MVKVNYDGEHNTVIVEFKGDINEAQAEQFFSDIETVIPKHGKGFKILTDFSLVHDMDLAVQRGIKKAMKLFTARGVTEILRVLPNPDMEIGFNIMSAFNYSKEIEIHTFHSREEAQARLRGEKNSSQN